MTVIRLQEGSTNSLQKQFSSFCRLLFLHAWVEINSYFWVRCGNTACWSAFHDSFFDPYLMTSILGWLQAGPLDQTMTQSGLMAGYACVFVQPITSHGRRPCMPYHTYIPYNTTFYYLMPQPNLYVYILAHYQILQCHFIPNQNPFAVFCSTNPETLTFR